LVTIRKIKFQEILVEAVSKRAERDAIAGELARCRVQIDRVKALEGFGELIQDCQHTTRSLVERSILGVVRQ
jgi:hypothetical protein